MRGLAIILAVSLIAMLAIWLEDRDRGRAELGNRGMIDETPTGNAPRTPAPSEDGTPGCQVEGRVVDSEGRPIAEASVEVVRGPGTRTDSEGRFSIAMRQPGPWPFVAQADGFALHMHGVESHAEPVEFVLRRGQRAQFVVADTEGGAIAGATISIAFPLHFVAYREFGDIVPVATSGNDGGFTLRVEGSERLVVSADSYATRVVDTKVERIVLRPGMHVGGTVVRTTGSPIAGARVTIQPIDLPQRETRTRPDGSFLFTTVPASLNFHNTRLTITAPGFAEEILTVVPGDTSVPIVLWRVASLRGILVRPDGSPAPNVTVSMSCEYLRHARSSVTTDDGTFRFVGLAPGPWRLQPNSGDDATWYVPWRIELEEGESRESRFEMRAATTSRVAVHVVDSAGRSIPDVTIHASERSRLLWSSRETDSAGRLDVTLPLPPDTPVELELQRLALVGNPFINQLVTVMTKAGTGATDAVITMQTAARVTVIVTDESGQRIEGARVSMGPLNAHEVTQELWLVNPNGSMDVEVRAKGYAPWHKRYPPRGPDEHRLVIALPRAASVTGRILAPDGTPTRAQLRGHNEANDFGNVYEAHASARGRFRMGPLPPGRLLITAERRDQRIEAGTSVEIKAGETLHLGDIRLSGMCRVNGTVVDAGGRPLPGTRIECRGEWRGLYRRSADMNGRYEIQVPRNRGTHLLFVRPRYGVKIVGFESGLPDQSLEVCLEPEARVIVRAGESVESIELASVVDVSTGLRWRLWNQVVERSRPPTPARVVIGNLPPGRCRIQFRKNTKLESSIVEREVDLSAGETLEIELD